MFTGIIQSVGTIAALEAKGSDLRLRVRTGKLDLGDVQLGDSIAVNGACLTVIALGTGRFSADVSTETLECTTLGSLSRGAAVNLERALRLGDRLGGHLVTGHVDGVACITERIRQGNAWRLNCRLEPLLARLLLAKGTVALDGISLTVNAVGEDSFSVMVIPHTLEQTTLAGCQIGDRVNRDRPDR